MAKPSGSAAPVAAKPSLCAEIGAGAREAEKDGDYAGHALLCEMESRLGQLRARLNEVGSNYSPAVRELVERVKSVL